MQRLVSQLRALWRFRIICGGSTLLWTLEQRGPRSRAFPFVTPGFVLVPMVSVWLFGERIKRPSVLDAACILVGIVTISSSQSRA